MTLAVLSTGLVSPFGLSPREHVFLGRAVLPAPPRPAFSDAEGEPIRIYNAPFLDVHAPAAPRMAALAVHAADDALRPIRDGLRGAPLTVALILPQPRPGVPDDLAEAIGRVLMQRLAAQYIVHFTGETGAFRALREAAAQLSNADGAWIVISTDSFVSPEYLEHKQIRHPRNRWIVRRPHPSEAAAVLVVSDEACARRRKSPIVGWVDRVAVAQGVASDENDEPTDGVAMTNVLQAVSPETVRLMIGQLEVDALRRRDICLATARAAARFRAGWQDESIEARFGMLGAAIGGASMAYGLALLAHEAADLDVPPPHAFLSWAIDGLGERAAATLRAETTGSTAARLLATRGSILPRPLLSDAIPIGGASKAEVPQPGDGASKPDGGGPLALTEANAMASKPDEGETDALFDAEFGLEDEQRREAGARAWLRPLRPLAPEESLRAPRAPVNLSDPPVLLTRAAFHTKVVGEVLEDIAVRGQSRDLRPLAGRGEVEGSLARLADALVALGDPFTAIEAWWESADATDPWTTFAAVFALGAFDDLRTAPALRVGLERLGDTHVHANAAAAALALLPHPRNTELGRILLASRVPTAHAVGIEVLSRAGATTSTELAAALGNPSASIRRAAMHSVVRWAPGDAAELVPHLEHLTLAEDRDVALAASVTLLRLGHMDPYEQVRHGRALVAHLGLSVLELLSLTGNAADMDQVEEIASLSPIDRTLLSRLARYGYPEVCEFMLDQLKIEHLADDAETALRELFGDAVPNEDGRRLEAWREAVKGLALTPSQRYRRGSPWTPAVAASECLSGALTAAQVEERLAELGARAGLHAPVDLWLEKPAVDRALGVLADEARHADAAREAQGARGLRVPVGQV